MASILEILLNLFGPLIAKWLESLLKKAAKEVPETGDKEADTRALFDKTLELTKGPFRRSVVRAFRDHAPKRVAAGEKPTAGEKKELKALLDFAG